MGILRTRHRQARATACRRMFARHPRWETLAGFHRAVVARELSGSKVQSRQHKLWYVREAFRRGFLPLLLQIDVAHLVFLVCSFFFLSYVDITVKAGLG